MTDVSEWFDNHFRTFRIMAILRGLGIERTVALATVAWDLGIDCVEVPVQNHVDIDVLAATVEAGKRRNKLVGAGTVVTLENVHNAARAGAAFTVSPGLDLEVVHGSLDAGLPTLPGVATPTEIQSAQQVGLTWAKAFPATSLGIEWFRSMRGPFPEMRLVATGGINATNARDFLTAGARVAAVGSALADSTQLPRLARLVTE